MADSNPELATPGVYLTHWNGGRPWQITIGEHNRVSVTENIYDTSDIGDYEEERIKQKKTQIEESPPFMDECVFQVFVGKSHPCRMTKYSGGTGPRFDGNSVLIRPSSHTLDYCHIMDSIIQFRTESPIVEFHSPVSNGDVPYPYAIDTEGRTYLISERIVLTNGAKHWRSGDCDDLYHYYFRHRLITSDHGTAPVRMPVYAWPRVRRFWIGYIEYTMQYISRPAEHYDTFTRLDRDNGGDGEFYIQMADSTIRRVMTKEEYTEMMQKVGDARGFKPLEVTNSAIFAE